MPRSTVLAGRRVLTPHGVVGPARLILEDGRIVAIEDVASAPDVILSPGFVDLQVNGIDDADVGSPEGTDWGRLDELLLAQGTTTWCPTLVTAPLARYGPKLAEIADAASRPGRRPTIAGAHLEGPMLGGRPGAHLVECIREVDPAWIDALPPVVRVVTLAPEKPGAIAATASLRRRGIVVALGHTTASAAEVDAARRAGASLVTHLFNAMDPLHHRHPGVVGAALADDGLTVSLIADGVHVHPVVLRLAARAKGRGRYALITDAVAWRSGRTVGSDVRLDPATGAPRLGDGTLAGSTLTMDRAVSTMVHDAGLPLDEVLEAATATPARLLGLGDRGSLAPSFRGDIVALDPDLQPVETWVAGEQAWARP